MLITYHNDDISSIIISIGNWLYNIDQYYGSIDDTINDHVSLNFHHHSASLPSGK